MQALFLGAGASFDCGLPLIWELTAEIRRWLTPERLDAYNRGWEEQGASWNSAVITRVNQLVADEDTHYEQILESLADDSQNASDAVLQQHYHQAYIFFAQAIYAFLLERQAKNFSFAKAVLKDYDGLKSLLTFNRPLWIFSTNQDVVVELMAARLDIPLKSGLPDKRSVSMSDGASARSIAFESLTATEKISMQDMDFFAEGEYGINLVKLQGGLDIFLADENQTLLKLTFDPQNLNEYLTNLVFINQANQAVAIKQNSVVTNHSWYQDTEGKPQAFERSLLAGYQHLADTGHNHIPDGYQILHEVLPGLEEVIAIGSRFNQDKITRLLSEWLKTDDDRRLTVVNPLSQDLPDVLRQSGNVRPLEQDATEFFLSLDKNNNSYLSVLHNIQRNVRRKVRIKLFASLTARR